MRGLFVPLGALAILFAGCSTLQTGADYDHGTDFSRYRTYTFQEGTGKPSHPFVIERVHRALTDILGSKGWREIPDGGDAIVVAHFHLDKQIQMTTTGYGYGWYGWYGGMSTATTTVNEIPVGTLVIDVVDPVAKKLVWRGWGNDEVTSQRTPDEAERYAHEVLAKILENFPPAR